MSEKLYCGQCGVGNSTSNKFCGQCGSALEHNVTAPIDYEYQDYKWRVFSDRKPDCVPAREGLLLSDTDIALHQMTETQARIHFWQKYQREILVDFQKWQDAGWGPITEVGVSCIELEKSSTKTSSFLASLAKAMFLEKWCFVGATIKMRRPISGLVLSDIPEILNANQKSAFRCIDFSPNGELLISGATMEYAGDIGIRLWDLDNLVILENTELDEVHDIYKIRYCPDGNRVVFINDKGQNEKIFVLDTATTQRIALDHSATVLNMALSPNANSLASCLSNNKLYIWDIEKRNVIGVSGEGHRLMGGTITDGVLSVAFTSDGRYVASGGTDNTVRFWEVETGQLQFMITIADLQKIKPVYNIAFSSNEHIMAIATENAEIQIWDWQEKRKIRSLDELSSGTRVQMAFSPDGSLLAGGVREKLYLWRIGDILNGNKGYRLPIPNHFEVTDVVFSPNGRLLASAHDTEARLWKLSTLYTQ